MVKKVTRPSRVQTKAKATGKAKAKKVMDSCCGNNVSSPCGGAIYGLGFLGSVIYYISTAGSFGAGVVGILKSIVWPAFLIFELFKFLGM